ncbi:hydroxyethylthiazole kinase [Alteribacter aurantiacus]|uniref:hydroxyethylthiazole kinase n=1 Tax=Alteribacter aurantiacus TaxID=254410 RepID=UPI0005501F65|nr:hydroxyethylthiazole kinase [Alteribacter aurantiacus]
MDKKITQLKQAIVETSPLIHNITNVVVTNFTANGLYALGASPVMAYAKEEVADMVSISNGLVLNIGTLTEPDIEAMLIAGRSANEHRIPVVLDPVGVGATSYRTETAKKLLNEVDITLLRGNLGEISNLIDEHVKMKGVDSNTDQSDAISVAKKAAKTFNTLVALTGKVDVITDGERTLKISNGSSRLTKVTGTGCLLSSVASAFLAVSDDRLEAVACAVTFYGIASEVADDKSKSLGIGHFQSYFLDEIEQLSEKEISNRISIEREGGA